MQIKEGAPQLIFYSCYPFWVCEDPVGRWWRLETQAGSGSCFLNGLVKNIIICFSVLLLRFPYCWPTTNIAIIDKKKLSAF